MKNVLLGIFVFAILAGSSTCASETHAVVKTGGAILDVTFPDENLSVTQADLLHWVTNAADAVTTYYGRFPVPRLTLRIRASDRRGIHGGTTYPTGGGLIIIHVGRETRREDLQQDWMLTHEMIHLAFPSMSRSHHWIEEGISTYVEPIARVQSGQLTAETMWHDVVRDMPQGLPEEGDQGLDRTHTWGRTYWGGALFCLVADVRIREQTHNRKGLQDALRAIVAAGGVITEDWDIERALKAGDQGTGTSVLMTLYREMADRPASVDLPGLWRKLGIEVRGQQVVFNSAAPLSDARKSITERSAAPGGVSGTSP